MRTAKLADGRSHGSLANGAMAISTKSLPDGFQAAVNRKPHSVAELQMIAEAAYFRALRRNFEPGHELDDWIAAETEVEVNDASAKADGGCFVA